MMNLGNHIKTFAEHFWRILLFPSEEWAQISKQNSSVKSNFMGYLLPLVLVCSLLHFLCELFRGNGLMSAFGKFLLTAIFYVVFYYLFTILCNNIAWDTKSGKDKRQSVSLLAIYSMTVYFAVDILLLLMPGKSYLMIICGYVIYLIYTGCRTFGIKFKGSETNAVAIMAVMFVLLPIFLRLVLNLLFPKM